MYSYRGKILEVELGNSPRIYETPLRPEDTERYLGGLGLGEGHLRNGGAYSIGAWR
jgi:hypothetical protein